MSIVSAVTDVPKGIIKPLLNPKTLLIGAGITLGSLAFLSMVVPGIGVYGGLRPNPILPGLSPFFNRWPFTAEPMNVSSSSASRASAGQDQEAIGRAIVAASSGNVNDAAGYLNTMLQVT